MRKATLAFAALTAFAADSAYQQEIAKWREQREAKLKADDGWLTVVGLHWLHEGVNTVGSDPKSDAPLPASLPARVGTITLSNKKVHFKPVGGVQLKDTGVRLKEMDLKTDITPEYDRLALGRVKFFVIEREDRFAVRVKDNDSEARKKFAGLRWYAADPSWKIQAKFIPSPHQVIFDTEVGPSRAAARSTSSSRSRKTTTCGSCSATRLAGRPPTQPRVFYTRRSPRMVLSSWISTRPRIHRACSPTTRRARCRLRRTAFNWR
jgi:uncharacterized protein (DUF1684 family)